MSHRQHHSSRLDDEEAADLYMTSGFAVKVSDCRREDEWEGTDVWDEGEFPSFEEAVERARREAATEPTDPAKPFRHVWIEDGDGEAVWDSTNGSVPREDWAEMLAKGDLREWGEGRDLNHPVQPGVLNGIPFEVEFEFDDGEEIPHEADDRFWLDHVASIRWVRE